MLSGPATLMGCFLRALVKKDRDTRERLRAELIRTGWEGASAVVDHAFLEAVRLRFEPGTKTRELEKYAYRIVRHFRAKKLSISDVATYLRWGAGEEVSLDRVPDEAASAIEMIVLVAIAQDLRLTETQIDELLIRAERNAYVEGYRPTLAGQG